MTLELGKLFTKNAITALVYKSESKQQWDSFVSDAKNGVFLFNRDYMEYHANRFVDHSLLFFKNKKLVALLPANLDCHTLHSHAGLTFGGIISGYNMTQALMSEIFKTLINHCKKEGISEIIYKAVPYIYHSAPANEDLYALFNAGAKLLGRNCSSSIFLAEKGAFNRHRLRAIRIAEKNNLLVKRSFDFQQFMALAQQVIGERHGVKPVHSADEIERLARRFPDNIKLFASYKGDKMLAGIIIYESKNIAHGQYGANSDEGRSIGAEDLIVNYLVNDYYKDKKYFDFGISTENCGQILNRGLAAYKEGFQASTVVYDFYRLPI